MNKKQPGFVYFYNLVLIAPAEGLEKLLLAEHKINHTLKALGITAILYTLVYVFLLISGGYPSTFTPWLNIPAADYYRYNLYFLSPSLLGGWLLASAVCYLLAKPLGNKGGFDDILTVLGFGISIASWPTLVHDFVSSFLGALGIIDQAAHELAMNTPTIWRTLLWVLMLLYLIWFITLFYLGIRKATRISKIISFLLAVFSFAVYQAFFLLFNR